MNRTQVYYSYVFHRKQDDSPTSGPEGYQPVGHVLYSSDKPAEETIPVALRQAFEATNSEGEQHWSETLGHYPAPVGTVYESSRSTSIGDLLVVGNTVFEVKEEGFSPRADLQAIELLARIPEPENVLHALMLALAAKYRLNLSFGYIGNLWNTGPEHERDDRCWSVFYQGPPEMQGRKWGHFSTKELPVMAERALTKIDGQITLEAWAKALSQGQQNTALRLAYAFPPKQ